MKEKNLSVIRERQSFNPGTLLGPLPAVLVTVGDLENSGVLTVAWCGILSTSPQRVYISVRPSRFSHGLLKSNGEFVINLTTEELAYATDFAGIYTSAKVNKFEKLSLTKLKSEMVSPPTIAESPLSLECKVFQVIESGTHDIFMADILRVSVRGDLVDEKGKICLDRANLLAYAHGEYFGLGKSLGKFGFSTDKNAKAPKPAAKQTEQKREKPKAYNKTPKNGIGKKISAKPMKKGDKRK